MAAPPLGDFPPSPLAAAEAVSRSKGEDAMPRATAVESVMLASRSGMTANFFGVRADEAARDREEGVVAECAYLWWCGIPLAPPPPAPNKARAILPAPEAAAFE